MGCVPGVSLSLLGSPVGGPVSLEGLVSVQVRQGRDDTRDTTKENNDSNKGIVVSSPLSRGRDPTNRPE